MFSMVFQTVLEFGMDEKVWSIIVFVLAMIPWISYCFMLFFFAISLLYGLVIKLVSLVELVVVINLVNLFANVRVALYNMLPRT